LAKSPTKNPLKRKNKKIGKKRKEKEKGNGRKLYTDTPDVW
jgi:hypothetical protein